MKKQTKELKTHNSELKKQNEELRRQSNALENQNRILQGALNNIKTRLALQSIDAGLGIFDKIAKLK